MPQAPTDACATRRGSWMSQRRCSPCVGNGRVAPGNRPIAGARRGRATRSNRLTRHRAASLLGFMRHPGRNPAPSSTRSRIPAAGVRPLFVRSAGEHGFSAGAEPGEREARTAGRPRRPPPREKGAPRPTESGRLEEKGQHHERGIDPGQEDQELILGQTALLSEVTGTECGDQDVEHEHNASRAPQ